ncbi:MAG TPA: hypothetical protein VHB25_17630 [Gemmatimonadaceae bacterium]|nr:hypothetical protein [Gemmatimonadaceae bacterium]
MRIRTLGRSTQIAALAVGLFLPSHTAIAQRGKKDAPEFTRQGLLIVNFTPGPGANMKLGRNAGNDVRSRVNHLANRREVDVIDGGEISYRMERAGYNPDTTYSVNDMRALGKFMRADEYLIGRVSNGPAGPTLEGELVLMRDERLRQPLPAVHAPKLDSAVSMFAHAVVAARAQLAGQRRCENDLREGRGRQAIADAREGVAIYAQSTLARTCLMWAMRQMATPSSEILDVAHEALAVDPRSYYALESGAVALDSLKRRDEAADLWLRLADTDTNDADLTVRVSYALFDGGNARRAEPFLVRATARFPDDIRLVQQLWRVAYENRSWKTAIGAAESMLARDSTTASDSTFFLRLANAYHSADMPYKAVETAARAVAAFKSDQRLYAAYAVYVRAEADTVIPRGLALFPRSADLLAMSAKELRAKGKLAESLDATKQAVALDSTMKQGQLMVAQLEIELGRPDSALVALRRAIAGGEDSTLVAQFALSKGNTLYRAANGTKTSADFGLALRYLAFADTIRGSQQSRFLVGAAALGVAQSAVTEAAKLTDKSESCRLARLSSDMLPVARDGLQAGQDLFAEAAKQSLDFLNQQLDPYVGQQVTAYCGAGAAITLLPDRFHR